MFPLHKLYQYLAKTYKRGSYDNHGQLLNNKYYGISEYRIFIISDMPNICHKSIDYYDQRYVLMLDVLGGIIRQIQIYKRIYYKEFNEVYIELRLVNSNQFAIRTVKYKSNIHINTWFFYNKCWEFNNYIKINLKNNKVIKKSTALINKLSIDRFTVYKNNQLVKFHYISYGKNIKIKLEFKNNIIYFIKLYQDPFKYSYRPQPFYHLYKNVAIT